MITKQIAIILNGISLQKKFFYKKLLPPVQERYAIEVFETRTRNDGMHLSSRLADSYRYDLIIAAGGDGTLHQVVNGVLKGRESEKKLPAIGLIPIGSGNDFARTVNIKADSKHLLLLMDNFKPRPLDVGLITYCDFEGKKLQRYFINVADLGMGPEVVKRLLDSGRIFGSSVAYYKSIITTFIRYKPMNVHATSEGWNWSGKLRSMAIANGKYYGHGLCVAPDAKPDNNRFSVFICGDVSVFDFIRFSGTMKRGEHIPKDEVKYKETTGIDLRSEKLCLIEGDGEILGRLPARVEMTNYKLNFLI